MAKRIKSGDDVIVIAGRSKGTVGKVLKVSSNGKILVEGVNLVKKHVKPNPQLNEQGGIREKEAFIDVSNVSIYNSNKNCADGVSFKVLNDGKKVRCFKSDGEMIDK